MDIPTTLAFVGSFVGLIGGGVALFNSWKAVGWKRAELANSYLRDFYGNEELVFACRCLDWNGGKLVVPDSLCHLLPGSVRIMEHDRSVFSNALRPDLLVTEMDDEPRAQIYRTAIDSFLSWLGLVASALDRKLFKVADIEDAGYWIAKIQSEPMVLKFILAYGYETNFVKLVKAFREQPSAYQKWIFPINAADLRNPTIQPDPDTNVMPVDLRPK